MRLNNKKDVLRARNVSAIASTLSALGTGPGAIDWLCPDYAVASAGVSKAVRSSFAVSASPVTGLNTKVVRMSERSPFLLKKSASNIIVKTLFHYLWGINLNRPFRSG